MLNVPRLYISYFYHMFRTVGFMLKKDYQQKQIVYSKCFSCLGKICW